jgi:hypothetical protein
VALAFGDPAGEFVKRICHKASDPVAKSTHEHRCAKDLFLGMKVSKVQHNSSFPVLLLRVG